MLFFSFVLRNVRRRPTRSLLTTIGLAVAVAAVISLVGISSGFEKSFQDLYAKREVDLVVQRTGGTQRLSKGLDESLGQKIEVLSGVRDVSRGLMDVVAFPENNLFVVIVNGWAPDSQMIAELKVVSGRRLQAGDKKMLMLGRVLAANLDKKFGDTVEIYGEPFEVVGIYEADNVFENGGIAVLLEELQRLMDRPHQVTGFTVRTEHPEDPQAIDAVRRKIEALQTGITADPATEFIGSVNQIRTAQAVAWLTSAIALIIGAVGVLNTMIMSVYERAREIGTLRAIGWKKRRVVRMIMVEALLLSIGGAILGSVAAIGLTRGLSSLPMTSGLIQGTIAPSVVALGFLIALLVGVGGAAYPAYWGASLPPIEALRRK